MSIDATTRTSVSRAIFLAALVLTFAVLYVARDVFIPLALALLLTFILAPFVSRLQRLGLPRIPALGVVLVFAFAIIASVGWLVVVQAADLANMLPSYRQNISAKVAVIEKSYLNAVERSKKAIESIKRDGDHAQATVEQAPPVVSVVPTSESSQERLQNSGKSADKNPPPKPVQVEVAEHYTGLDLVRRALGPIINPFATAMIVLVFTIFMLFQREDLRDRIIRLCGRSRMNLTTEVLDEASDRVSRYLQMLLLINGINGACVGIGLTLLGVPNGFLWGLLAGLLRFIPYVGPWIAAMMPITLAITVFDGWTRPLMVVALFLLIELLCNNFLEPWLYGTQTGASPFAIVVSALFWAWLWGGVGLLLATPLTVCLVVLGKFVPQLEFLNILLGDTPPLKPSVRYYQRLLALDREEADDIIESELKTSDRLTVFDEIIIPALKQAENERHHGDLNELRERFIFESARDLVEELQERAESEPKSNGENGAEPQSWRGPVRVVCVPARDEADELVARMLAGIVDPRVAQVDVLSYKALASELIDHTLCRDADLVCISALPPSTIAHSRYLCKRLHRDNPDKSILVGLWTTILDEKQAAEKIGCGPNTEVVRSLKEAIHRISSRAKLQPVTASGAEKSKKLQDEMTEFGKARPSLSI